MVEVAAVRACGDAGVDAGRGPGQRGWYEWAARFVSDASVLDVGCGLGYGLDILATAASSVQGQDLDPRLKRSDVYIGPLHEIPAQSVDVVLSVDVVEHIDDDRAFLSELVRIARDRVIVTTPNWTAGRCRWPYHVREYTPAHLRALCTSFGSVQMWKGTPNGEIAFPITYPRLNHWFNASRATTGIDQLARVLNQIMPIRAKIHSHLAAIITLRRH